MVSLMPPNWLMWSACAHTLVSLSLSLKWDPPWCYYSLYFLSNSCGWRLPRTLFWMRRSISSTFSHYIRTIDLSRSYLIIESFFKTSYVKEKGIIRVTKVDPTRKHIPLDWEGHGLDSLISIHSHFASTREKNKK